AAHVDARQAGSVRALADQALAGQGRLDIWMNSAGIYPSRPLLDLSVDDWDAVLDVNLRGTFVGAQEAARAMIAAGNGGVIVNVSSTAAYRAAGVGVAHYVASKFGVRGLTQSLAVELGPHGIRVLAIAPTVTLTPGLEEQREALEAGGFELESLGASLPLGRVCAARHVGWLGDHQAKSAATRVSRAISIRTSSDHAKPQCARIGRRSGKSTRASSM